MPDDVTSLGIIVVLLKPMQTTVLQLRRLREDVIEEVSRESLDAAIAQGEVRIADVKRKPAPSMSL
jgi:hypothetical protein